MFSAPNYTQTPNEFFDSIMPMLSKSELLVTLVIMRQTFGWQKRWDCISLTQMEKKTGLSRTTMSHAIQSLVSKKLIIKHTRGEIGKQKSFYTLAVTDMSHDPSDEDEFSNNSYPYEKRTGGGTKIVPTKETITKERKKKKREKEKDSPSAQTSLSFVFFDQVKLKKEDHEKLEREYGKDKIKDLIAQMNEYSEISPKKFKAYANHAAVIRSWIRRSSLTLSKSGPNRLKEVKAWCCTAPIKDALTEAVKSSDVEIGPDFIHFLKIHYGYIPLLSSGAQEKIKNNLRKMKLLKTSKTAETVSRSGIR